MGYANAWATVRQYVGTNWTATAVKFPNVAFTEPPAASYIALTMSENSNGGIVSVGPATAEQLYRYYGFLVAQIFALEDQGQESALALADQWTTLFGQGVKRFTVGAKEWLNCITASTVTVGNTNGRYQVNVLVAYQRDQFTTGG